MPAPPDDLDLAGARVERSEGAPTGGHYAASAIAFRDQRAIGHRHLAHRLAVLVELGHRVGGVPTAVMTPSQR